MKSHERRRRSGLLKGARVRDGVEVDDQALARNEAPDADPRGKEALHRGERTRSAGGPSSKERGKIGLSVSITLIFSSL